MHHDDYIFHRDVMDSRTTPEEQRLHIIRARVNEQRNAPRPRPRFSAAWAFKVAVVVAVGLAVHAWAGSYLS